MANVNVKINGEIFKVKESAVKRFDYNGNSIKPEIYVTPPIAGQLVKQFVKKMKKDYICKVRSESFSMGNSINVNVCNPDGTSICGHDFELIRNFVNQFKYGWFNGMYDSYEHYENSGAISDLNTKLIAGCKFTHIENNPNFGTVEYLLNEVKNNNKSISDFESYYTESVIKKAKKLI